MTDQNPAQKKDGRKFALIIISFFLTIASVDAYFVYKAVTTHSGTVAPKPYEIGLNYNAILKEAKEAQQDKANEHTHTPK